MKTIQEKIKDTKKELKKLENQLQKEKDKSSWIKIPELNIEVQVSIHHKGKSYNQLKEEFGEEYLEENLPTYSELQALRNLEHNGKYKLGLIDSYEFVKQEDLISKKNGYIAGFCADSDCADLGCNFRSSGSDSYLGVRFVRRTKVGNISKTSK